MPKAAAPNASLRGWSPTKTVSAAATPNASTAVLKISASGFFTPTVSETTTTSSNGLNANTSTLVFCEVSFPLVTMPNFIPHPRRLLQQLDRPFHLDDAQRRMSRPMRPDPLYPRHLSPCKPLLQPQKHFFLRQIPATITCHNLLVQLRKFNGLQIFGKTFGEALAITD